MRRQYILSIFMALTMLTACSTNQSEQPQNYQETQEQISALTQQQGQNNSTLTLGDNQQYYGDTFGQGEMIDIYIELPAADWEDMLENPMEQEYHEATITVNDTTASNVGFRTKGNSSLMSVAMSDSDRYGFRVKIDKYDKDQRLNGLDEFVLNASFADPSYMREYLTYAAMNYLDGVTPYMSFANLYINGELYGFYLMIEALDDSFVERLTDNAEANLYKADTERCTLTENDDAEGFKLQVGDDKDKENVKNLITVINETIPENKDALETILDVDSVLRAIAINTVMGNYDSYSGSKAHNYFLLYADGKFTYIGWDYNMSLGGFNEDDGSSVTADITMPIYNVDLSKRPMIEKILAVDEYYNQYMEYLEQLVDYFGDFEERVNQLADIIKPYVKADPTAFYSIEQFENNIIITGEDLSERTGSFGRFTDDERDFDGQFSEGFPRNMEDFDGSFDEAGNGRPRGGEGGSDPNGESFDFADGQRPEFGEGMEFLGRGKDGQQGFPDGMGNSMVSYEPVSIVDYMTQRLASISQQLEILDN